MQFCAGDRFFARNRCSVQLIMKINCILAINYHHLVYAAGIRGVRFPSTYTAAVNNDATNKRRAGFINPCADTLGSVRRCLAARGSLERSLRVIKLPRGETTEMYVEHRLKRKSLCL